MNPAIGLLPLLILLQQQQEDEEEESNRETPEERSARIDREVERSMEQREFMRKYENGLGLTYRQPGFGNPDTRMSSEELLKELDGLGLEKAQIQYSDAKEIGRFALDELEKTEWARENQSRKNKSRKWMFGIIAALATGIGSYAILDAMLLGPPSSSLQAWLPRVMSLAPAAMGGTLGSMIAWSTEKCDYDLAHNARRESETKFDTLVETHRDEISVEANLMETLHGLGAYPADEDDVRLIKLLREGKEISLDTPGMHSHLARLVEERREDISRYTERYRALPFSKRAKLLTGGLNILKGSFQANDRATPSGLWWRLTTYADKQIGSDYAREIRIKEKKPFKLKRPKPLSM